MDGNEEADKLATLGVEMHEVPKNLEKEVAKQDILVEGILRMMLNIMENVHDKASIRKKEERQALEEAQRKFQ
eukprot:12152567-Heterocapsa_arctica.AAC.1